VTRTVFDPAADVYDRTRPDYPLELYAALADLSGRTLAATTVVEVGAGTGIATEQLTARGANILALDLSLAMLRRHRLPGRVAAGRAEALPVRDSCADLVCFATAFHWADVDAAGAESHRVLRPGGALAVWWNRSDTDVPWVREQWDAVSRHGGEEQQAALSFEAAAAALRSLAGFSAVASVRGRWQRTVTVEDSLAELTSHSRVISLGAARAAYLEEHRGRLQREFPDGRVVQPFTWDLHVAQAAT